MKVDKNVQSPLSHLFSLSCQFIRKKKSLNIKFTYYTCRDIRYIRSHQVLSCHFGELITLLALLCSVELNRTGFRWKLAYKA